jgi:hypothetical protein
MPIDDALAELGKEFDTSVQAEQRLEGEICISTKDAHDRAINGETLFCLPYAGRKVSIPHDGNFVPMVVIYRKDNKATYTKIAVPEEEISKLVQQKRLYRLVKSEDEERQ